MNTREYYELFRYLMGECCLAPESLLFVESVAGWCREHNITEPDTERPFKLVSDDSGVFRLLIKEDLSDEVVQQRINALGVRSQLENVAVDREELLNTDKKRLAYLFLHELALRADKDNERDADKWALEEMERLGFFKQ
jgi:hypothetical protein